MDPPPRKKEPVKIYMPPGRRSEDELTPKKARNETPVNCCEQLEDGELEPSPMKCDNESIKLNEDGFRDFLKISSPKKMEKNNSSAKTVMCQNGQLENAGRNIIIPVTTRTAKGKAQQVKTERKSLPSIDVSPSLSQVSQRKSDVVAIVPEIRLKFHANDVPYIDSHCHTDFIYDLMMKNSRKQDEEEGVRLWVKRIPEAWPKSFAGFIANFIQPDLFVLTNETEKNNKFDIEWVERELSESDLYLGTTWGCHPHHAQKWGAVEQFWNVLEEELLQNRLVFKILAVGECGIDLHRCVSELSIQQKVFARQVELAYKYNLPLVVHCRNGSKGQAEDLCLEIIQEKMSRYHPFLKIHRHCFTEDWETAKKWLQLCPDVHFGFTAAVFSFKTRQIEAIRRIPLDRILLETDGPYFKPKSFEGVGPSQTCLPGMAIATAFKIAEIKGLTPEEVLRATYNNTRRVYQIPLF